MPTRFTVCPKNTGYSKAKKERKQYGIQYTHLMTCFMVLFMVIFIIDRFTTNLWPLYFTKASPVEHDFTATTFFIVAWIMGRELIVAYSLIWLFQCKCFWNVVFEHKPGWLIVDDIMIENNYLHFHLGWFGIGVPMIVHTWLVFLPLLQREELYIYLTWWRPIDPETNFHIEVCHHSIVHVSINDIYALLICTVIFLVLFPLSMYKKFKTKHWTLARYIHIVAALLYAIELLRTPFTAHCWYISTPFIICYVVDRFLGMFYYRTSTNAKIVHQYNIDEDYILLFMNIPGIYASSEAADTGTYRQIGDCFWINTRYNAYHKFRPAHPFTTFFNHNSIISNKDINKKCKKRSLGHRNHKFSVKSNRLQKPVSCSKLHPDESYELYRRDTHSELDTWTATIFDNNKNRSDPPTNRIQKDKQSFWNRTFLKTWSKKKESKKKDNDNDWENHWNVGFLIRVHARKDEFGFTQYMKKTAEIDHQMLAFGPYRSSFANIISEIEKDITDDYQSAVVLIATGAGAAYVMDFMLYLRAMRKRLEWEEDDASWMLQKEVRIHFSCRSIKLFQWITDFLCEEYIENVHVCAHLTSHKNVHDYDHARNRNKVRKA
eukprot:504785_1